MPSRVIATCWHSMASFTFCFIKSLLIKQQMHGATGQQCGMANIM
jgi:hypothetical protein